MTKPAWKTALVSLVLLPFALSCSKKSTTGPSGGGGGGGGTGTVRIITLTTNRTQIQPNNVDYATLRATATDSAGKGVEKITVHFSSKLGTGVTINPDSGLTDAAGQTVTSVRSSRSGIDTITATVGSLTARVQINYTSYSLAIDSLGQSVPPGGVTVVRATLRSGGAPVKGDTLAFSVTPTHGSQVYPPTNVTDDSGRARTAYRAGNATGFDTITVSENKLNLSALATITIGGGTPEDTIPAAIYIESVNPYFLFVRGGGGTEKSDIKVTVYNRNGTPIKKPTRVDFTFVQSPGGGEFFAPSSGMTDSNGSLATTLNSGTKSGTVKFKATVYGTTISTYPTIITIRSGPPDPAHVSIFTEGSCILPGRTGYLGDETGIGVYVADQWGNPVPTTSVWFWTNQCMIYPGNAETDETGYCHNTFRTAAPNDSTFATVTAQTRDSLGNPINKTMRLTLYGNVSVFSLSPTNWVIDKVNGPRGVNFTLTVQDDRGIGLPGTYTYTIAPEGYTSPSLDTIGVVGCLPSNQLFFLGADTLSTGYTGPASVTAHWQGLHQSATKVDSGTIR